MRHFASLSARGSGALQTGIYKTAQSDGVADEPESGAQSFLPLDPPLSLSVRLLSSSPSTLLDNPSFHDVPSYRLCVADHSYRFCCSR